MLITTFRPSDWNRYARRFVESVLARWPEETKLRIYYQGVLRADYIQNPRIEYVALSQIPRLEELRDAMGKTQHFRGMLDDGQGNTFYSYRHDAHRWCLKAFALAHAATTVDEEYIAWCDADVFWHTDVPEGLLRGLVPPQAHLGVLDRSDIPMYPETGFVVVHTHHPINQSFWRLYVNQWMSGAIGLLREWHCCQVLEYTYRSLDAPRINLGAGLERCMHPAINSVLGEYMDHFKGKDRKKEGHSNAEDLVVDRRNHPYWKPFYEQQARAG